MIEGIEELGSELEVAILIHVDVLRNREIEVCQTWASHDADAGIAECLRCWTQSRKRIGVEPPLDGSLRSGKLGTTNKVRASHAIAAKTQNGAAAQNCG